jgi:hypothetical protein
MPPLGSNTDYKENQNVRRGRWKDDEKWEEKEKTGLQQQCANMQWSEAVVERGQSLLQYTTNIRWQWKARTETDLQAAPQRQIEIRRFKVSVNNVARMKGVHPLCRFKQIF